MFLNDFDFSGILSGVKPKTGVSNDFLTGYLKSGGWRFGGQNAGQPSAGYKPEGFNGGLLDMVGNPFKQGVIDKALNKEPVTTAATTGLLGTDRGGGRDFDRTSGPFGNGTNLSDKDWETKKEMRDFAGGWTPGDIRDFKNLGLMALGLGTGQIGIAGQGAMNAWNSKDREANELQTFRDMKSMQQAQLDDEAALRQIVAQQQAADANSPVNGGGGWSRDAESVARDAVSQAGGMGKSVDGDTTGMSSVYAKGGLVRGLMGPDPEGPDDGYAALDKGEYVVKASAVKKLGKKTLDNINKGKLKKG